MSSAICFSLDQSKISLSGNGLKAGCIIEAIFNFVSSNAFGWSQFNPFPKDKF